MGRESYTDEFVEKFLTQDAENSVDDSRRDDESPTDNLQRAVLKEQVVQALKQIYDPEIPVNIYDLGLIYQLEIDGSGMARVEMTLTTPGCPVAHTFPGMVECAVKAVPGITDATVDLVWDPPWSKDQMSEAALLELGLL